jgi:hypothetical protein
MDNTKRSADRVEIRAVRRQLQASDARGAKDVPELLREERISVVDQVALADQETIDAIGEVARDLLHPRAMRLPHDAADLYPLGLDVDEEEHEGANEAGERQQAGELLAACDGCSLSAYPEQVRGMFDG